MKILLILVLTLLLVGCSPAQLSAVDDELAQCLTEKGAVMYGTEWCGHCKNQKRAFGSSFEYINYVDCDESMGKCSQAGVTGYPTWVINGQNYPGEQSLSRLKQLAGC
jgi:glutaredoxin